MSKKVTIAKQISQPQPDRISLIIISLIVVFIPLIYSKSVYWYYDTPKIFLLQALIIALVWRQLIIACESNLYYRTSLDWLIGGIAVLSVASSTSALHPQTAFFGNYGNFYGATMLILNIALFFAVVQSSAERNINPILYTAVAAGAFIALIDVMRCTAMGAFAKNYTSITMGNITFAASYLVMLLPIAIALAIEDNKNRIFLILSAILIAAGIMYTLRLSGALGLTVSLIILIWAMFKTKKTSATKLLLALAPIAITLFLAVAWARGLLAGFSLSSILQAPSLLTRFEMWKGAMQIIKDKPLLGVGPDNFGLAFQKYTSERLVELEPPGSGVEVLVRDAHNILLNLTSNLGLLGMILFLASILVILLSVNKFKNLKPSSIGILAGLSGYVATCLLSPDKPANSGIFFLLLGLFAGQAMSKKHVLKMISPRQKPLLKSITAVAAPILIILCLFSFSSDYYFMKSFRWDTKTLNNATLATRLAFGNDYYELHLSEIYAQTSFQPGDKMMGYAIDHALLAQKKNGLNPYNYYYLGRIYESFPGDNYKNLAIEQYGKALELYPNYPQPRAAIARIKSEGVSD